MEYTKKLSRMTEHLNEHPHDYQTVIAQMKLRSKAYDDIMRKSRNGRLKRLSEIKKRLREEDLEHEKRFK